MKKHLIFLTIFTVSLLSLPISQVSAQGHQKGQVGISAGVGYNLLSLILGVGTRASENLYSVPPISGAIDYGISDRFSLGVAATYQGFGLNYDAEIAGQSENVEGDFSCINIGLRPLFHFGQSEDLDIYAGIRVSTSIWNASSDAQSNNPDYDPLEDWNLGFGSPVKLQPVLGMAYFFGNGNIGINGEIATAPYLVSLGAKARF